MIHKTHAHWFSVNGIGSGFYSAAICFKWFWAADLNVGNLSEEKLISNNEKCIYHDSFNIYLSSPQILV